MRAIRGFCFFNLYCFFEAQAKNRGTVRLSCRQVNIKVDAAFDHVEDKEGERSGTRVLRTLSLFLSLSQSLFKRSLSRSLSQRGLSQKWSSVSLSQRGGRVSLSLPLSLSLARARALSREER